MAEWYHSILETKRTNFDPLRFKPYDYMQANFFHDFRVDRKIHVSVNGNGKTTFDVWTRWPNEHAADLRREYEFVLGDSEIAIELRKTFFGYDDVQHADPENLEGMPLSKAKCIRKVEAATRPDSLIHELKPKLILHHLKTQMEVWRLWEMRFADSEQSFDAAQKARSREARHLGLIADRARHSADNARDATLRLVCHFDAHHPHVRIPSELVEEAWDYLANANAHTPDEPSVPSHFF